jgi:ATP/maltotriose-dependent transcriptional regulator MalT
VEETFKKKLESPDLHYYDYTLSFLQHDNEEMSKEGTWAAGKAAEENVMLYLAADVAGYSGQAGKARDLSREAVDQSLRMKLPEIAARCAAAAALREATFGNWTSARQLAGKALSYSRGRDEQYLAALALAMAGDTAGASALGDDLAKRYPQGTLVQSLYLPTLRAQILPTHPTAGGVEPTDEARKAIEILQAAAPYELGAPGNSAFTIGMYPVYVRGMAYLREGTGQEAVREFQKIIEHPGVVAGESIASLAYLGLARGYAMAGEKAEAKSAYESFLQLWKAADGDVPVLAAAKAEYAKLG